MAEKPLNKCDKMTSLSVQLTDFFVLSSRNFKGIWQYVPFWLIDKKFCKPYPVLLRLTLLCLGGFEKDYLLRINQKLAFNKRIGDL